MINQPACVSYTRLLAVIILICVDIESRHWNNFMVFSSLVAERYKTLHKYEYQYEAESLNAINGASQLKNGPKASCKVWERSFAITNFFFHHLQIVSGKNNIYLLSQVEIEVPQTCSFIVRTTGCSLSEVVNMDAEGNPVFGPAPGSAAFAAEMERYIKKKKQQQKKLFLAMMRFCTLN